MTKKRISITLPLPVFNRLKASTAPGTVSEFVTAAIQEKLLAEVNPPGEHPFFALRRVLPKFTSEQLREARIKGRT